ncbi:MAG TPA: CHASE3 domain-containing protein [Gaiellales bacterium]|nr:CHASE3 domain-containing protein [Gaiellales bacterium]
MNRESGHPEGGGRRARNALGVLIALLAAVLGIAIFAAERIATSTDTYVDRAVTATAYADDILLEVASEQTGVRSYFVTRQTFSLQAYQAGRRTALEDLNHLQGFVAERPSLAPLVQAARSQLEAVHRSFQQEINLVRNGHIVRAQAAAGGAQVQLRALRRTIGRIHGDVGRFVAGARESQRRTYLISLTALLGFGVAALLAGCWLFLRVPERMRELETSRRRVLDELLRAEELERGRIAAELHDDTIQAMTAALMTVDRLSSAARAGDTDRVAEVLPATRTMLADAVERARRLTFELHPPLLEASGLGVALTDLIKRATEDEGLETVVDVDLGRYPFVVEDLAYRIVREAVANARRRTGATRLEVDVREHRGAIHGRVWDNGVGAVPAPGRDRDPLRLDLGLDALAERARLADGDLAVRTAPGGGTLVAFWLPLVDSPSVADPEPAATV